MQSTDYIAVVEVATRLESGQDDAAAALREYQPEFSRSPRGWVEVKLKISATGLAHACATAAAMARVATGSEGLACQVMTQAEYDARRYATSGRHAAEVEAAPMLPRQPTDSESRWSPAQVDADTSGMTA